MLQHAQGHFCDAFSLSFYLTSFLSLCLSHCLLVCRWLFSVSCPSFSVFFIVSLSVLYISFYRSMSISLHICFRLVFICPALSVSVSTVYVYVSIFLAVCPFYVCFFVVISSRRLSILSFSIYFFLSFSVCLLLIVPPLSLFPFYYIHAYCLIRTFSTNVSLQCYILCASKHHLLISLHEVSVECFHLFYN